MSVFTIISPRPKQLASRQAWAGAAGLCLVTLLIACGGTGPSPLPPQTVTGVTSEAPPVSLTPELPDQPPPVPSVSGVAEESDSDMAATPDAPADDGSLLVLGGEDRGPGETTNRDLVEASRKERERRRKVTAVASIDDENLAEQAEGGRVTIGTTHHVDPEELAEAKRALGEFEDKEVYWRTRAREIRERWRDAFDRMDELEAETEELRRKFYAAEDTVVRDRDIKPAWDRSQDLLRDARATMESARADLDDLYEDGRRAGALEGWLRDGIELEPWPEELEEESTSDSSSFSPP